MADRKSWQHFAAGVRLGSVRGLRIGFVFGCIALVVNLALGNVLYERIGLTPVTATAMYLAGGVLGGAIVGLMLPVIRDSYSAALAAAAAFAPFIIMMRIARYGTGEWRVGEVFVLGLGALIMGLVWGPTMWRAKLQDRGTRSTPDRESP